RTRLQRGAIARLVGGLVPRLVRRVVPGSERGALGRLAGASFVRMDRQVRVARIAPPHLLRERTRGFGRDAERRLEAPQIDRADLFAVDAAAPADVREDAPRVGAVGDAPVDAEGDEASFAARGR